jgi:hypothetical protein
VRRGFLGRWQPWTGTTLLVVCLSQGWCLGVRVWCVRFTLCRGVSLCLEVCHYKEMVAGMLGLGVVSLLDVPSLVAYMSMGVMIIDLGLRGATGHGLHLVVCVVLHRDVWMLDLGVIRWILLTPLLSKWHDTSLIHFLLTPVMSHLLTLTLIFYFQVEGLEGFWLIDSDCSRQNTRDRMWFSSLNPVMTKEYITFGGQWERYSPFSGHGEGELVYDS